MSPAHRIPPGPTEDVQPEDLLGWMGHQFKQFGDIYKASLYGTRVYAVRDLEFTNHVLVENSQSYVKGQFIKRVAILLGNGLMVSEGDLWKRQRTMIQPSFHRKSMVAMAKMMVAVNSSLRDRWLRAAKTKDSINVTRDTSAMALEVVLRSIFGDDYDDAASHFALLSEQHIRDLAFAQSFRALGKVIVELADRRRKASSSSEDILSDLLRARDPETGHPMPDRQIVNEILTLIVAGHETTASTLNWTWYLLSQHPDVEERLSKELGNLTKLPELEDLPKFPYTRQVLDESMRLYPAGWLVTRKALEDDQLGDYFVPAGTEIYISPYFIQRHPKIWSDPDRFNPDRLSPENSRDRHRMALIPFSAGPRNCIGALFARVEMQIHLMIIAKQLRLRYAGSAPPELDAGVNLRSKSDIIMYPEVKPIENR